MFPAAMCVQNGHSKIFFSFRVQKNQTMKKLINDAFNWIPVNVNFSALFPLSLYLCLTNNLQISCNDKIIFLQRKNMGMWACAMLERYNRYDNQIILRPEKRIKSF